MRECCPSASWRNERVGDWVEAPAFKLICDLAIVAYIALLLMISSGVKWSAESLRTLCNGQGLEPCTSAICAGDSCA